MSILAAQRWNAWWLALTLLSVVVFWRSAKAQSGERTQVLAYLDYKNLAVPVLREAEASARNDLRTYLKKQPKQGRANQAQAVEGLSH